ncbi:hypothetical protein DM01DRAFT_1399922 [Hesseltinella vesiculosa]|uniref:Chromo domain-containing protein n=1 Tax=Hesseltinella vesiculosa TaxID=101127 RepID=A0A1X2G2V5_9FUNG|nr:hypothetical protein DM01DRAFT_1399922 [Hesseltinella vesiculosa]
MFARAINDFKDYTKVKMNANTHRAVRKREKVIQDLTQIVLPAIIKRTEQIRSAAQDKFNKKKNLVSYAVGSLVSLRNPTATSALEAKYVPVGPFKVVMKNKGGANILQDKTGELLPSKYSPEQLKSVSEEPIISGEEMHYVVEAIIAHKPIKNKKGHYEYLIRWKAYDASEDTWQVFQDFDDVNTIINYWRKLGTNMSDEETRLINNKRKNNKQKEQENKRKEKQEPKKKKKTYN